MHKQTNKIKNGYITVEIKESIKRPDFRTRWSQCMTNIYWKVSNNIKLETGSLSSKYPEPHNLIVYEQTI